MFGRLSSIAVRESSNRGGRLSREPRVRAGTGQVQELDDAVAVVLGDMPEVSGALIDRLAAAIDPVRGALIAVPTRNGKRGNPVVWSRRLFDDLARCQRAQPGWRPTRDSSWPPGTGR